MTDCSDIYCRKKARERLKKEGLSDTDATEVAESVYQFVKKVVEKNDKAI